MAIREIVTFPDERLRQICAPVTEFDAALKELTDDMFETMYDDEGIGLAAPQIGIEKRIVVIDIPEEDGKQGKNKLVLINPKITAKEGEVASEEGCLSVPEYRAKIKRYEKITLECQDLNGQKQIYEADGLLAICMQHELDHLDGKLFIDYLSRLKRDRLLTKYRKLKKEQARAHE